MADYKKFLEKSKYTSFSSSESDRSSRENSPFSSSDEDSERKKKNTFHCRICSQPAKGQTDDRPEKEVCSNCAAGFPNHTFCKSCRRVYTNKDPFPKNSTRCKYCVDKLQRMREERNKRKRKEPASPERKVKRKDDNETNDRKERASPERKVKKKDDKETYVAIYIDSRCVLKKNFKV